MGKNISNKYTNLNLGKDGLLYSLAFKVEIENNTLNFMILKKKHKLVKIKSTASLVKYVS